MSWKRRFEDVELPNGKIPLTPRDGDYSANRPAGLPASKWQAAMRALIEAAEGRGLNLRAARHDAAIQRDTGPDLKPGKLTTPAKKWGRRKLVRDL